MVFSAAFQRLFLLFLFKFLWLATPLTGQTYDLLFRNGRVLDGTGNPWFRADIAVKDGRIAAMGQLSDAVATRTINATNLYIAPGFIDVHSHAAEGLSAAERSGAEPLLTQGITTVVINPDGFGPLDLEQQQRVLLRHGLGVNVIPLVGHGSVRRAVLGMADRLPNEQELTQMRELVRRNMAAGAFGLSSGPFYAPGSYSNTYELVELARVAAAYDGIYTSHIRDESNYSIGLVAAVDEVITIARETGVTAIVTHIKALGPPVWGYSTAVVQRIQRARNAGLSVYADQYPYEASGTSLGAALLPRWVQSGGRDSVRWRLQNPALRPQVEQAMLENLARRGGAGRIQFRSYAPDPSIEGQTLEEAARQAGISPVAAARLLLVQAEAGIVSFNMHTDDVAFFMQQPWTMTCSDGNFPVWGEGVPHPRAFGSFPRKIRHYVLDKQVIDLPTAIRSMTHLSAQVMGIPDRGQIRVGAFADLVVFDLEKITDRATFTEPYQLSEGMNYVVVNGQVAIDANRPTGVKAGRVLLKGRK